MKNNIESQLENAQKRIALSDSEKDFHRSELQNFIRAKRRLPVPSPFHAIASPFFAMRYAVAALLLVVASGAGIASASEASLPGDPLYAVKVRITEPVRVALTLDPKAKASLEVSLVDARLKEVAQASVEGGFDTQALADASASLQNSINAAQANIAALQESNDDDTAYESASDLQATLSAHAKILQKVRSAVPAESADVGAIAMAVEAESDQTDALVASTTDAIVGSDQDLLDESTDTQQDDTSDSLAKIKADIADALGSFDTSDRADVAAALDQINAVIARAKTKDDAGDPKGAYLLYIDAGKKITELTTAIEADQALNIDVIDSSLNGS